MITVMDENQVEKKKYNKKSDDNWTKDRERLVLYADIMGFKAKLSKPDEHATIEIELRGFIEELQKRLSPFGLGKHIRLTMFSDTIFAAADSANANCFRLIARIAAIVMQLCQERDYPISGCISCGKLTFDDLESASKIKEKHNNYPVMPLFFGKSIVDAYLVTEKLHCYGIVLHPNIEPHLRDYQNNKQSGEIANCFFNAPIPQKDGGMARLFYLADFLVPTGNHQPKATKTEPCYNYRSIEQRTGVRGRTYVYNTELIHNAIKNHLAAHPAQAQAPQQSQN